MSKAWSGAARWLVVAIALAWLAGCAAPYAPNTGRGGYKEEKLADNRYKVTFQGNGNTNEDMVVKYWLYRCAELTKQNGFTYFALLAPLGGRGALEGPPVGYDLTPAERARLLAQDSGMVQVRSAPTYIYVPTYTTRTVTTWSKTGEVLMLKDKMTPSTLHAQTVLDMLKKYVETQGKEQGPTRKDVIDAAMNLSPVPAGTVPAAVPLTSDSERSGK